VVEAENARKCMYHKFSKEATLTVVWSTPSDVLKLRQNAKTVEEIYTGMVGVTNHYHGNDDYNNIKEQKEVACLYCSKFCRSKKHIQSTEHILVCMEAWISMILVASQHNHIPWKNWKMKLWVSTSFRSM
jgi:hypothetical protein